MTYRIATTPKLAAQYAWSCSECGHDELGHPVFVECGNGPIAVGTGCAAKLLGMPTAELLADLATAELRQLAATHPHVATCWSFFLLTLPGRITPKYLDAARQHAGANNGNRDEVLAVCTATYKAFAKARRNPRTLPAGELATS